MKKLSIIIPAYNEAGRIGRTLEYYGAYFKNLETEQNLAAEFVVVLNGCKDNTREVAEAARTHHPNIRIIESLEAGKGLAIAHGFADAVTRDNDYIGFVDADMATAPEYFYDLIKNMGNHDGVIASRYMRGAFVSPARPWIKSWGRKIVYHSLIRALFGLWYKDFQCGAKVFKADVIKKVAPQLTVRQWAFDVELLYLCKKNKFKVKEIPTVWYDQADSKLLVMRSGMRMLGSLFKMRWQHSRLNKHRLTPVDHK